MELSSPRLVTARRAQSSFTIVGMLLVNVTTGYPLLLSEMTLLTAMAVIQGTVQPNDVSHA